jgi:hypothetical protein
MRAVLLAVWVLVLALPAQHQVMQAQWALAHQVWLAVMVVAVPALLLELQVVAVVVAVVALRALPHLAQAVAVDMQQAPAGLLGWVALLVAVLTVVYYPASLTTWLPAVCLTWATTPMVADYSKAPAMACLTPSQP